MAELPGLIANSPHGAQVLRRAATLLPPLGGPTRPRIRPTCESERGTAVWRPAPGVRRCGKGQLAAGLAAEMGHHSLTRRKPVRAAQTPEGIAKSSALLAKVLPEAKRQRCRSRPVWRLSLSKGAPVQLRNRGAGLRQPVLSGTFSDVRDGDPRDDGSTSQAAEPPASTSMRPSRGSTASGQLASGGSEPVPRPMPASPQPEQAQSIANLAGVRRFDEREVRDLAEPGLGHLQDHGREVGAQDLGLGELRTGGEVLLAVEPDADARSQASAASGPLVGRCLRDGFDRQSLHLGARRIARDSREPGVDHVPDAGYGQRGLGHVRGQDDPTAGVWREHPLLLAH